MSEEIKEKIKIATDAVSKIEDESYKIEAFKIILTNLIEKNLKSTSGRSTNAQVDEELDSDDPITILANKIGMVKDELLNVIAFEKNQLTLLKIKGKTIKEQNFFASLVILAFWKIGKKEEYLSNVKLGNPISKYGISTSNLSAYLKEKTRQEFIVGKGKGKSKEYRITGKGIKKAIEVLQELA